MNELPYSIWLVPCAEQRGELAQVIDTLSERFGTPRFEPHATLCSGTWRGEQLELAAAMGRLAAESLPVELVAEGIDWAERWSTFFFLRLRGETALFEQARRAIAGSHSPAVGPHLSLLYSAGEREIDRAALRRELAGRLPDSIRFDSLRLVCPATGCWEDVGRWHTLHVSA